jgi:hypothetical protein
VPSAAADPQLHRHNIILSTVLAGDHVGSADFSRLHTKVIGAVFHAGIATRGREFGVDMKMGPSGEARVASVSEEKRTFFSRRVAQGETAAKDYATKNGKDWDSLSGDERIDLLKRGVHAMRQDKQHRSADDEKSDFAIWQDDARPGIPIAPLCDRTRRPKN